jgi:hypothetical protein
VKDPGGCQTADVKWRDLCRARETLSARIAAIARPFLGGGSGGKASAGSAATAARSEAFIVPLRRIERIPGEFLYDLDTFRIVDAVASVPDLSPRPPASSQSCSPPSDDVLILLVRR